MTELKMIVDSPETAMIIISILEEIKKAEASHPDWPVDNVKRAAIVLKEAGEVIREANLLDEGRGDIEALKTELIQTAGTCIRHLRKLANESIND